MRGLSFNDGAGGVYRLSGELTAETVPQVYRVGRRLIEQAAAGVEIDLAAVGRADSAGLALLIDWLAWAARCGKSLRYSNLPAMVEALAGLSEVLPLLR